MQNPNLLGNQLDSWDKLCSKNKDLEEIKLQEIILFYTKSHILNNLLSKTEVFTFQQHNFSALPVFSPS